MVISEPKILEEILGFLENCEKIIITGCGECATVCKTGGQDEVEEMKQILEQNGKKVLASKVLPTSCNKLLVKKELKEFKEELKEADAVLSLACGDGVQTVGSLVDIAVIPGNDTLFIGEIVRNGIFEEMCKACGECVLGRTAAVCPVTKCAKSLLNGPCGGAREGKCEVNPENPCAWIEIYKKLKDQERLDLMIGLTAPKDYSKVAYPRTVNLKEREGGKK